MMVQKEKRQHLFQIRMTDSEMRQIRQRMERYGVNNLSAYIRAMALNGFMIKLDLPEIRELIFLLRNMTNNLNQIAQRVNSGGTVYETELDEIKENQQLLWKTMKESLAKLTAAEMKEDST